MGCGCSTLDERISIILAKNKVLNTTENQIKTTVTKITNKEDNPFMVESENSESSNEKTVN